MSNYLATQVLPNIATHRIGRLDIECITVKLTPEEWDICDKSSGEMWANKKSGSGYARGLLNTEDDKHRSERIGRIGEVAFSKISGLPVDLTYIHQGDDHDFESPIGGIDIKTSAKCPSYKQMLIMGEMHGREMKLSPVYVAAFLAHEDKANKKATVVIVGWATQAEVISGGLKKGRKGSYYKNYEVHYRDLRPIAELLTLINPELDTFTQKPEEEDEQAST